MNREKWLSKCIDLLRPDFEQTGSPLPERIRATCGWPSKAALAKRKRFGEVWSEEHSADGTFEIFISPLLEDSLEVAATLVHELVHCAVGLEKKHGAEFRALALKLGLEGKMTGTRAGDALKLRLQEIIKEIFSYPHAELIYSDTSKKQSTRMLKLECSDCGYTVRTTQKWIDVGLPTCPCGMTLLPQVA